MKNSIVILLISILFIISCKKETATLVTIDPPPPVDTTISVIKYEGIFENGPYGITSGSTLIVNTNGKLQLRLEGFQVSNGPDLKVYISREKQPLNFIRLGSLKAFSGDQVYDISGNPDFMLYRYVLIHCEKFNHLFGSADLMVK